MKNTLEKIFHTLHKPSDPSLLAFLRICFGICMMIDIPQERGMAYADTVYEIDPDGGSSHCTFPLIHGLEPFSVDVMVCLYAVMFLNALFITVGFLYRFNTISFALLYWYIFMLDTTKWNNHSYLYGLIALLLCATDANKFLSLDSVIQGDGDSTSSIPHWNYIVFRFQVFIVYFYAGLKKTEADWLMGYSMRKLSREWVFVPLKPFMSNESIDYWVIHVCGFIFDLTVGFLLLFGKTRPFGLILCLTFHGMNAMIFNIGMFPYVMFACSFIFCKPTSFKNFLTKIPLFCRFFTCIEKAKSSKLPKKGRRWTQLFATVFCVSYMATQAFLPYSHFITKGYNGWTQGLYGYSWDMMVHSFSLQHIRISYKDLENGEIGYLKPGVFLSGTKSRWTTQPAMAFQYATCIKEKLKIYGIKDAAVYFDVWKSMNGRFKQRIFNPETDIANYTWSLFEKPSFVMPILAELSDWRDELKRMKNNLKNVTTDYKVVFVADFPGLYLANYLSSEIGNVSVHVLNGEVMLEMGTENITLKSGERYPITTGGFHRIYTLSEIPSCYYYIYMNATAKSMRDKLNEYENWLNRRESARRGWTDVDETQGPEISQEVINLYDREQKYRQALQNVTRWDKLSSFLRKKTGIFRRSSVLLYFSIRNLVLGKPTSEEAILEDEEYLDFMSQSENQRAQSTSESKNSKVEL